MKIPRPLIFSALILALASDVFAQPAPKKGKAATDPEGHPRAARFPRR